jgi:transcriptional regulator with XRE-family HTH domain
MTGTVEVRHCARCGSRLTRYNHQAMCGPCEGKARDLLLRPPVVPAAFWQVDQMRDALATWHIGRVIYAYRTHPYHGRTLQQELVGTWLGVTQAQLSRLEKGRAPEEISKLIRYAQILGIPADLLWFKLPEQSPAAVAVAGSGVNYIHLIDLAHWMTVLPKGAYVALPVTDRDLQPIAAALQDSRRYLDESALAVFRDLLDRCKAADGLHGPAAALPLVLGILQAIQDQVSEVKPAVRRPLLSLGSNGAEFAGWLYRDLRNPTAARYWLDRAMEWAQEAGDMAMQGYVLLKKSQMAYEERDAVRVLTFAQAAQYGPWQMTAAVRSEVTQQEARGLAMCGEHLGLVEQKLDDAFRLLTASDHSNQELGSYYDEGTVLLRRAACYLEAGKPSDAAALFGEVLANATLSRRDEGYFRARRAIALAISNEPDEAATEGLAAQQIVSTTKSQRTARELSRAVELLAPWTDRPGPRELSEAVSA